MAKAVWTGSLSFGLVNIPVKLYNATVPKDVRFHQFQGGTGRRIRYRRVTEPEDPAWSAPSWTEPEPESGSEPATRPPAAPMAYESPRPVEPKEPPRPAPPTRETEVPFEQIMKGFEIEPDRFVMVSPDELRALEPERSQAIEIEGFVDLQEIDPVYFEKSYYVAPQRGVGAERTYALLLHALQRAERVGIARFVLRTREYLAAIRPTGEAVMLETLFFADEVRPAAEIDNIPSGLGVDDRELGMAMQFVELLDMAWDPGRYRDSYREKVMELIRARAETEGVLTREPQLDEEAPATALPDLMAALRASVEAAKERRDEKEPGPRRSRRRTG
jgi:DNA end-binding protein Ku